MAETITIAGRKFPKTGVYVAAAGTAGVLGWAWWTRAREDFATAEAQREIDESLPGPVAEPTDTPGFDVVGGIAVKTNAEWTREAVLWLQNNGIDATAASAAIGKFMARQTLNATEASLVEQAIASTGPPPENGPWQILRQTPGQVQPPATLPAPTGLRAIFLRWSGNTPIYRISWNPVSGAKDYHWQHGGGSQGFTSKVSFDNQGSAPGKVDTWHIAARGVDNKIGPKATLTFTAASKTSAQTKPTAPKSVKATAIGGGKARIVWSGATGGAGSYYEIRSRGVVGDWRRVNGTSYTTVARWKPGTLLAFEVRTRNSKGTSPGRISNRIRIK